MCDIYWFAAGTDRVRCSSSACKVTTLRMTGVRFSVGTRILSSPFYGSHFLDPLTLVYNGYLGGGGVSDGLDLNSDH
jgi:hypothetical protein